MVGPMTIPERWWSWHSSPGLQVKFGSSRSATLIRSVADSVRIARTRRRKSPGQVVIGHQFQIEHLGSDIRGHSRGQSRRAVREGDADDAFGLHQDLGDLRVGFDRNTERTRFLLHGRRDRAHAADGVSPSARNAIEFAERMV